MERPIHDNVNGLGERLYTLIASPRLRRALGAAALTITLLDFASLQTKHESSSFVHVLSVSESSVAPQIVEQPRYLSFVIQETTDPTLSKEPVSVKAKISTKFADRPSILPDCEKYRHFVAKYWPAPEVDNTMVVMRKESTCDPKAVSKTNDYGLMGLHNVPILDPELNLKYAYEHKYVTPRRGTGPNWSAWFSVCTRGNHPVPMFPGFDCF